MSFRVELEPEDLRPARTRGPGLGVAVALCVMVLSAAGVWAGWRALHHGETADALPVIHADETPVKTAPTDPGGLRVPDQNMEVLNNINASVPKVEQLLPPPETPLPRPAPAAPTIADVGAAPASAAPQPGLPVAPAAAAVSTTIAVPAVAAASTAPPAVPTVVAEAKTTAPTTAPSGGYRLQVGALRTPGEATAEWNRLKRTQADILGALGMRSVRTDLGAKGIYYRIEAGPIADAATAERLCGALKERKVGCILVRP
jgi:hypothetical protein